MKTRPGFVSNSSSSSFVMLGFKSTGDSHGLDEENGDGFWCKSEGCMLVGDIIAEGSDYNFQKSETDIATLVQRSHKIAKKHGVPLEDVKLYTGVRQC